MGEVKGERGHLMPHIVTCEAPTDLKLVSAVPRNTNSVEINEGPRSWSSLKIDGSGDMSG